MKTIIDYYDHYLKTDVLLLADLFLFEEFRNVCLDGISLLLDWLRLLH